MKKQWETPELEEMPVVILSLHQKWWQKMAAGEKVLELRKTKPQCKAPFRVLVYVTGGAGVLGEFICPEVLEIKNFEEAEKKRNVEKSRFLCGLHGRQTAATGVDRRTGGRRLMEDRQKIIAKLVKIKALAERGIGGEQQTAQVMYTTLKEKYKVTDAEIEKAAEVPVDISEIDLKKFWGIAFQLATVAKTLQEETDICTACPYTYTDEQCTGCGTYWNMRDLRLDFEAIQQRLAKAAAEV